MAKYCAKCGKSLPDGVEICPFCSEDKKAEGDDAALFTKITADTEVWKEAPKPGKKPKKKRMERTRAQKLTLYGAAVLLVAVTVLVIWYTLPATRVQRAVRGGAYDRALELYTQSVAGGSESSIAGVGKALVKRAETVCALYESGELDRETAEASFTALFSFGIETKAIDEQYARYEAERDIKSTVERAQKLIANEQYLEACDLLLTVPEDSLDREAAQAKAEECLDLYAESVLNRATDYMGRNDYVSAIAALRAGNEKLKVYDTFSTEIDAKFAECLNSYEQYTLQEAKNLADLDEYEDAVSLVLTCLDIIERESPDLDAAYEEYHTLAVEKTSLDAVTMAYDFYGEGDYASAFRELDTAASRTADHTAVTNAIAVLEKRFSEEMTDNAKAALDGNRDNVDAAIAVIDEALAIRAPESLTKYRETLEGYKPQSLITMLFEGREGDVYRINGEFEALSGRVFSNGWMWGSDGGSIRFLLEGEYDALEGDFAARRDDEAKVSAYFEVYCDGELKYTSETLGHDETVQSFSFDVSGVQEVEIVFHPDYDTVTGNGGYCYHGICAPRVVRNMDT